MINNIHIYIYIIYFFTSIAIYMVTRQLVYFRCSETWVLSVSREFPAASSAPTHPAAPDRRSRRGAAPAERWRRSTRAPSTARRRGLTEDGGWWIGYIPNEIAIFHRDNDHQPLGTMGYTIFRHTHIIILLMVPSGELSHFAMERSTMLLMGKSTISMAIFHGKMLVHQRVDVLKRPEKHVKNI